MRKSLWATLAVALLLGNWGVATAQEAPAGGNKPLVVVSFAGYDQAMKNLETIGKLAGKPDLAKELQSQLKSAPPGKALDGLDKTRPWGLVIQVTGQEKGLDEMKELPAYLFLPVTDLKQVMSVVPDPETGKPLAPGADGVYELQVPGQSIFITQKGTWAYAVRKRDELKNLPADPTTVLGDLPQKYTVAARVSIKALPAAVTQQGIDTIKMLSGMFMQKMPRETDEQFALRRKMFKQSLDQLATLAKELDEVLLGWGIDKSSGATFLDVSVSAQPGTKTAGRFAKLQGAKSRFSGFLVPDAALSAVSSGEMDDADVAQAKSMLAGYGATAMRELDRNSELTKEQLDLAKKLLGDAMDVLDKTLETKKSDGGMVVFAKPGAVTAVVGASIAEGMKLENVLRQLVAEVNKENPEMAKLIKLDAEKSEGVNFHVATIPMADEKAAEVVGQTLPIVVAIGPDMAFVGVGQDARKTIKQMVAQSKELKAVSPMQMTLTATPIAKLVATLARGPEKAIAGQIAEMLGQSGGKDRLTVVAKPIANGLAYRVEVEEGLMKAIATMAQMADGPGKPAPRKKVVRPREPEKVPAGGDDPFGQ